jgi:hypothetical protein
MGRDHWVTPLISTHVIILYYESKYPSNSLVSRFILFRYSSVDLRYIYFISRTPAHRACSETKLRHGKTRDYP